MEKLILHTRLKDPRFKKHLEKEAKKLEMDLSAFVRHALKKFTDYKE